MKSLFVSIVFICIRTVVFAQELVANGDFEILNGKVPWYQGRSIEFWQFSGMCYNCNDDNTNYYFKDFASRDRRCNPKFYPYLFSKTKLWMNCSLLAAKEDRVINNGFAYTKLKEKLKVGSIYKVEFNLFLPSSSATDSSFYKQIGVQLSCKSPTFPASFYGWHLLNDSIILDQWFVKTWYVQTFCEPEFLVLGVSQKENTKEAVTISSEFFVDKVSVVEVKNSIDIPQSMVLPFRCSSDRVSSPLDNCDKKFDLISLYFEPNCYKIENTHADILDSFARYLPKNYNEVYEIVGFTDDVGEHHEELANKRTKSVVDYLCSVQHLNSFQLIQNGVGNVEVSKGDLRIREKNRRVDIELSNFSLDQIIYQKLLAAPNDSAFVLLKAWMSKVKQQDMLLVIFDHRLDYLKTSKFWPVVLDQIRASYRFYKKPLDSYLLDSMKLQDQKHRTLKYDMDKLTHPVLNIDEMFEFPNESPSGIAAADSLNYIWARSYLAKYGWPNRSDVGARASRALFYIVDHFADTTTLTNCAKMLESKCKIGEGDWGDYAMLFDRNQMKRGEPQWYATQYTNDAEDLTKIVLYRHVEETTVNKKRKEIGLEPISDFRRYFFLKNK
jgi:outer membrane protein OmpA-like peptidoglycan-associated protein